MPAGNRPNFDSTSRTTLGGRALTEQQPPPVAEGSRRSKLRGTVQPGVPTHARKQHPSTQSIDVSATRAGKSVGARTAAVRATTPGPNSRRTDAAGVEQRFRREIQQRQTATVQLLRRAATQPKAREAKGWRAILNRLFGGPRPVKPADIAASLVRVNDSLCRYDQRRGDSDDAMRRDGWAAALEALPVLERLAVVDLLHDDEFLTRMTAPSVLPRDADTDRVSTPLGEAYTLVAAAQAALPSCCAQIRARAEVAANEAVTQNKPQCLARMLRAAETQLAPIERRLPREARRQMALDVVSWTLIAQGEDRHATVLRSGSLGLLHELHARAQEIGIGRQAIAAALAEKPGLIKTEAGQHTDTVAAALHAWRQAAPNVESPACRAAASQLRHAIQQYETFVAAQGLDYSDFVDMQCGNEIQRCNDLIAEARREASLGIEQLRHPDISGATALGAAAHAVRETLGLSDKTAADLLQALAAFDREVEKHQALAALAGCPMGQLRAALLEDLLAGTGTSPAPGSAFLQTRLDKMDAADLQRQLEGAASFSLDNDRLEAHAQACRLIGHLELLRSHAAGDLQKTDADLVRLRPILLASSRRKDPQPPPVAGSSRDPAQAQQTRHAIEGLLHLNLPPERPAARGTQGRYDDGMMAIYTRAVTQPFPEIPGEAGKVDLGEGLKPSDSFMRDARDGFAMYLPGGEPVIDHQGWDALDERQRDERIHAGLRKLVAFYGDVDKVNALTASLGQDLFSALIEPWASRPVRLPGGRRVAPFHAGPGKPRDPGWGERRSDSARLGKTRDGIPCFVLERTQRGGQVFEARNGAMTRPVNLDPSSWQRVTCALQLGADLDHVEPMPGSERPHYEFDLRASRYQKLQYPPPSWEVLVASTATNPALRNDLKSTAGGSSDLRAKVQAFTAIRQFAAHPCGATAAPVLAALGELPDRVGGDLDATAAAKERAQRLGKALVAAFDDVRRELRSELAVAYRNGLKDPQLRDALYWAMGNRDADLPSSYSEFLENATPQAMAVLGAYFKQPDHVPEIVDWLDQLDRFRASPSAAAAKRLLKHPLVSSTVIRTHPDTGKTVHFGVGSQLAQDARDRVEAALRDDAQSPMDAHLFDPLQEHLKPDIELLAHQLRTDIEARRVT